MPRAKESCSARTGRVVDVPSLASVMLTELDALADVDLDGVTLNDESHAGWRQFSAPHAVAVDRTLIRCEEFTLRMKDVSGRIGIDIGGTRAAWTVECRVESVPGDRWVEVAGFGRSRIHADDRRVHLARRVHARHETTALAGYERHIVGALRRLFNASIQIGDPSAGVDARSSSRRRSGMPKMPIFLTAALCPVGC